MYLLCYMYHASLVKLDLMCKQAPYQNNFVSAQIKCLTPKLKVNIDTYVQEYLNKNLKKE